MNIAARLTSMRFNWTCNVCSNVMNVFYENSSNPWTDLCPFNIFLTEEPVSSSNQVLNIYRKSIPKAAPQLLEPIMKVDVYTPDNHVGDVIGDLNRRRGIIKSQDTGPTGTRVNADAPLGDMFGYIGDLRTMTSGRGQFTMEFSHYAPCPANISEIVVQETLERKENR